MSKRYDDFGYVSLDPVAGIYRLGANGPSLTTALAAASATRRQVALLHIDIDMFNSINVNMGEEVGDKVLAVVAQRLLKTLPPDSWLWRLASDEFIAAVGYRNGESDGASVAGQICDEFETPVSIPPYTLPITLSIGIAVFPDHAHNAAILLAKAEQALLRVKQQGLDNIGLYTPIEAPTASNNGAAKRFAKALDNNEFRLFYQPLINAHDGSLCGFSALLRWQTAQQGLLTPSRFLEVSQRLGLSSKLGWWVVEAAMRQLAQWRQQGLEYLDVSVHLHDELLTQRDCVDQIGQLLHRYGLAPRSLEFEISESALALNSHQVQANMIGLRALGAILTVHDFGLGSLSLSALSQYSVDRLKIDRSFVRNVASDHRSAAIVRGIIAMGHSLGMKVIAKGVENETELGFLRRNHCDFFQGYLFSPPAAPEDLDEVIRRRFLLPSAFAPIRSERTLLLLDDEENVLRSLARLFRRDGYRILTANSVREAFDLLASNTVQVILSDQRMPDMSGTEFLTRVRDLYPDTVRLVLSGYTDLATITDAINHGAIYRFLTKPWNDDELREHIKAAFNASEQKSADIPA